MKAKDIMNTSVVTVGPDTTIEELVAILTESKISGVPVVDGENVVGIVTEGDLLHRKYDPNAKGYSPMGLFEGFGSLEDFETYRAELKKRSAMKASEIMTTGLITEDEDSEVTKIASVMVDNNINRVPIVKDGKLVGIVTRADVIRTLAK